MGAAKAMPSHGKSGSLRGGNIFSFSFGTEFISPLHPPTLSKPINNNTAEPNNNTKAWIASVYITVCKPPRMEKQPLITTRMMGQLQKSTPRNELKQGALQK